MSVDSCGAREIRDTADDAALGPRGDGKITGRVAGEKVHLTGAQPVHRDKWDDCHEAIELGVVLGKGDCRLVLAYRINRKLDLVQ